MDGSDLWSGGYLRARAQGTIEEAKVLRSQTARLHEEWRDLRALYEANRIDFLRALWRKAATRPQVN